MASRGFVVFRDAQVRRTVQLQVDSQVLALMSKLKKAHTTKSSPMSFQ